MVHVLFGFFLIRDYSLSTMIKHMSQKVDGKSHKEINSFISFIIWVLQAATATTAVAAAAAGVTLPGQLEGPGPQVSLAPSWFLRVQLLCRQVLTRPLPVRASSRSASRDAPPPPDTMSAGRSGSQQQTSAGSVVGGPPAATATSTASPTSTPSAMAKEVPAAPAL
jgi:hypothetical protein